MDDYEKLRTLLAQHPAGAPKSAVLDEILRILFTADEVKAALGMGFRTRPAASIAADCGLPVERVVALCESMAAKGIIFSSSSKGVPTYGLLPTIPGIFEFPFMTGGGTPMHARLGRLWEQYHQEAMGREFASSATPLTRVIPVETAVDAATEILPYDVISGMLQKTETFALAECACRASLNRCSKPRDVCLIFDKTGRYLIERKLAREIDRERTLAIVRRAEEAGLVHLTNNSQDRLNLICNCCPCCCTLLRGLTELKMPSAFALSRYVAASDDGCIGCGVCAEERCPVKAITVEDGRAVVDPGRCIGCGLCVSTCASGAMRLAARPAAAATPATTTEMAMKVLAEKGRLEGFMQLMKK